MASSNRRHRCFRRIPHIDEDHIIRAGLQQRIEIADTDAVHRRRLRAAELAVVNQVLDRRTVLIHRQCQLAETHRQSIHNEQATIEAASDPRDQLDGLAGLDQTDQPWHHAHHTSLSAGGNLPRRRGLRQQISVVGTVSRSIEHTDLTVKPLHRAIDQGLAEQHTGVVHQEAGREVVGSVADKVVGSDQIQGVVNREHQLMDVNTAIGIEICQPAGSGLGLGAAQPAFPMNHLSLKVGELHNITVHDADPTYTGSSEIKQQWRAEASTANAQNGGVSKPFLTVGSHLGKHQMTGVALPFSGRQIVASTRGRDHKQASWH